MMKDSFVFYTKYKKQFELLTNEQRGILIMAVFEYNDSGIIPKLDDVLMMAFSFIQADLDADRAKWEETCKNRAKAGSKGGKQKVANLASATFAKQNKQKVANVADSECEGEGDSDCEGDLKENPLTPLQGEPPELIETVESWLRYKKERRQEYKPTSLEKFVSMVKNKIKAHGVDAVVEVMNTSMSNNWQGVAWKMIKTQPRAAPTKNAPHGVDPITGIPYAN